eukprot:PhF_6_TR13176/c0_g1_i1/m.20782
MFFQPVNVSDTMESDRPPSTGDAQDTSQTVAFQRIMGPSAPPQHTSTNLPKSKQYRLWALSILIFATHMPAMGVLSALLTEVQNARVILYVGIISLIVLGISSVTLFVMTYIVERDVFVLLLKLHQMGNEAELPTTESPLCLDLGMHVQFAKRLIDINTALARYVPALSHLNSSAPETTSWLDSHEQRRKAMMNSSTTHMSHEDTVSEESAEQSTSLVVPAPSLLKESIFDGVKLGRRNVGILLTNLRNTFADISRVDDYATCVTSAVAKTRGTILMIHGDRILSGWGVFHATSKPLVLGCKAATDLQRNTVHVFSSGLASSECEIRIVTTPNIRSISAFGVAVNIAQNSMKLCKSCSATTMLCLASPQMAAEVGVSFVYQFVGLTMVRDRPAPAYMAELMSERPEGNTEWMYQLEDDSKEPMGTYNISFLKLVTGGSLLGVEDKLREILQYSDSETFNERVKKLLRVVEYPSRSVDHVFKEFTLKTTDEV